MLTIRKNPLQPNQKKNTLASNIIPLQVIVPVGPPELVYPESHDSDDTGPPDKTTFAVTLIEVALLGMSRVCCRCTEPLVIVYPVLLESLKLENVIIRS